MTFDDAGVESLRMNRWRPDELFVVFAPFADRTRRIIGGTGGIMGPRRIELRVVPPPPRFLKSWAWLFEVTTALVIAANSKTTMLLVDFMKFSLFVFRSA